jgi:amidase
MGSERFTTDRDAVSLRDDIAAGRTTAGAVLEDALARIDALEGELRAFVTIAHAAARADAARLDLEGPRGRPLFGLPLAVKDLLETAGLRTTHGSLAFAEHVPELDDVVVARARAAGAVVVGKTNTPEFGFGAVCRNALQGPTANPLDPSLTSGGSSGGSAVAVTTGMAALSLGTDYGGSVRTPAAFCGVVGFRPTPGRLPTLGRKLASDALNTTGFLTRSVRDARLLFEVVEGPDARDPISLRAFPARAPGPARPRIAATLDFGFAPISAAVAAGLRAAMARLERSRGPIAWSHPDCTGGRESFSTLRGANIHFNLSALRDRLGDSMSPTVRWNIERGEGLTANAYLEAEAMRWDIARRFEGFFDRHDLLVSPSAAILPFRHEDGEVLQIDGRTLESLTDYFSVTYIVSLVGCPAVSVPFWPPGQSLPIGLQLIGRPGSDYPLLDMAEEIASALAA